MNVNPFIATTTPGTLKVTTGAGTATTATLTIPGPATTILVTNAGTVVAFSRIRAGANGTLVATNADVPIPPGWQILLSSPAFGSGTAAGQPAIIVVSSLAAVATDTYYTPGNGSNIG